MPKRALATLGVLVRGKRGERRLREVAKEIGVSPATLMRIEAGRIPDVETFGKICLWLAINTSEFLGAANQPTGGSSANAEPPMRVSAHFKADRLPLPETATALARMLLFVAQRQAVSTLDSGDVDDSGGDVDA